MKKAVRLLWVLAANGFVIAVTAERFRSFWGADIFRDPTIWAESLLEIVLPAFGIVAELAGLKVARLINVGAITLAGCLWLAEAVWWHSDPFFGVLLLVAIAWLAIAGMTEIVYRYTTPTGTDWREYYASALAKIWKQRPGSSVARP